MNSERFEPEKIGTTWIEGSPEVLRERLVHKEREILQQKQDIRKIRADLNKQADSLKQTIMLLSQTMKDLKELTTLLELEKEKNKHLEEAINKKNMEVSTLSEIKVQYDLEKEKYRRFEEETHQKENEVKNKKSASKYQALFSSLLFLSASLLASFGANMLTLTPPDPKGIILISFAVIIYLLATIMTVFILGGSK